MDVEEELKVGDAMTRGVICVDVEDTVQKAADVMRKNDISSVIVTEKGDGVGIITERDVISKIVAENKSPTKTKVSDVMTCPLITISPQSGIDDAARMMRDNDIHRLVVSDKGKIIGVLSDSDIVRIEPALHLLIRERSQWDIAEAHAAELGAIAGICEICGNYSESLKSVDGCMTCSDCV